ncbi:MAG: aminotransferase class I/II-fold pyridoxal phosphate-dependent enzyme [Bacteroidota bacterium]|nr:aminotransferase class I/II-fold pyridoxal phosphate-dependent enzyme [Bacteroidota bacterium]MDP4233873.1 aminotransferase class I/II-fold pyridoxal phosphate-dependent enzyme [Bacteroidota bacterium]MDP4243546.1 aminotransferase class I/II-fold pyridoxal phosphate-dependent enzyme [Bacteroidota bacterium]MDP4288915.1 aminotransferase class I/II-fold pyridoxal phosphate-dependent enzyme [Bacteroidota bacterium]
MSRTEPFFEWQEERRNAGLWPYSRIMIERPDSSGMLRDERGTVRRGLNFASQDYLSLASHPAIIAAAAEALHTFGPHSAGSPVLTGNTTLSSRLEREISDFVGMEHVLLFPTGWAAGFGAITGLVRPYDHILIDSLAHACLQAGANAATQNVRQYRHLDAESLRSMLVTIRATDSENGILIITEGLFSMDSDVPEIERLQALAHEYDATLFVDVAHDFGATGPGGAGTIARQHMLGKVDLVMGSFSKTFASNGGFLASNRAAVWQTVKYYGGTHIFSNALSPIQAAVVSEALRIVRSEAGEELRQKNRAVSELLRTELHTHGLRVAGEPSPIVPVMIGSEKIARIASKLIAERGLLANLVEFPAVAVGTARFRMQCMAGHRADATRDAARIIGEAVRDATNYINGTALGDPNQSR